jgi:hypothetical protein
MTDLSNALRIAMHTYAPRFSGCLGIDEDGRTYYALSPGLSERKAAQEIIAQGAGVSDARKNSKRSTASVPGTEEREALAHWPWFIAVYGKKPGNSKRRSDDDMDTDEDDGAKWWGFSKPEEIKKLATWITEVSDLNTPEPASNDRSGPIFSFADKLRGISPLTDTSSSAGEDDIFAPHVTRGQLKSLVKALGDYADNLEWRIARDDTHISHNISGKKTANGSTVTLHNFYS